MERFLFSNCTIVQNELFMVGVLGGLPAKMSLDNSRIDYCDFLDGFIFRKKNVIVDYIDYFQNKVYMLDSGESTIIIWDLGRLICQYVALGGCHRHWTNFAAFERYQTDYYIFPKYENRILVFHTDRNEITEIIGYLDDFDEVQCICRVKDCVWVLPKDADVIYCNDLASGKREKYELKKKIEKCVHAVYGNDSIYILNMFGTIYRWDIEKAELQEITLLRTEAEEKLSMNRIICAGNKLILLPALGNEIRILDIETERAIVFHNYPDGFFYSQTDWFKYYGYCEDKNYYYFAACAGNYLLKIRKKTGELIWTKPQIDSMGGKVIDFLKHELIYESNLGVADLIMAKSVEQCCNVKTYVGQRIYDRVGGK